MRIAVELLLFTVMTTTVFAQDAPSSLPNAPSAEVANSNRAQSPDSAGQAVDPPATFGVAQDQRKSKHDQRLGLRGKLGYYMTETYFNPAVVTAPALRAGIRIANPPSHYPLEWKQGSEAFGRNYGDAFAERVTFHTAQALTGIITREDPRYEPSSSHNVLARSFHALAFTFVDRSDSGHPMPAVSNFVGAAAGGFVGNAYLPSGFDNLTHAGQRATVRFGFAAGGNLFREFVPQMPSSVRTFFMLFAR